MGDPSGIGPEIILKSFEDPDVKNCNVVVVGDFRVMTSAYKMLNIKSYRLNPVFKLSECIFDHEALNILDLGLIRE